MKRKLILAISLITMASICLAGCSPTDDPTSDSTYDPITDSLATPYLELMEYYGECETPGTIDTVTYNVESYALENKRGLEAGSLYEDKTMYVYLPYGYTAEKQYDVLYLLHGSNEVVDYWFYTQKTVSPFYRQIIGTSNSMYSMNYTKNVVDNLIAEGKCDPFIIVTPSYHSTLCESTEYGSSTEDTQFWLTTFETELRNDIIPLIESTYSTYAGGDVSEASIQASRDHRSIAGFSKGARYTTGYALNGMLDIFSSFGCFHGCEDTSEETIRASLAANPGCSINYLYLGAGTNDIMCNTVRTLNEEISASMTDIFTEGENYTFYNKEKGEHYYDSALLDLYNFLQIVYAV